MKFKLTKFLAFATFFSLIFFCMCLFSDNKEFILNNFTSGSDDLRYIINATNALSLSEFDVQGLLNEISFETEHAYGYPLIIYLIYKLFIPNLFLIIFFNFLILFKIYETAYKNININYLFDNNYLLIILMPGLIWVSMHAFKDILLLYLTFSSFYYARKKKYILSIFLAILTELFRPYNSILIILVLIFCNAPIISIILSGVILILFKNNFQDKIIDIINISNDYAIRDLNDSNSSFTPTSNFLINYLLGMFRFVFLPTPWGYKFHGFNFVFDLLEFIQSIIIWFSVAFFLMFFKKVMTAVNNNKYLFLYTFCNASVYSVIYFGSAQPRYRVYVYLCFALLLISVFYQKRVNEK